FFQFEEPAIQIILARQRDVDVYRRNADRPLPDKVEYRLDFVRDLLDDLQTEKPSEAFDAMKSAKDRMDYFQLLGILVERDQLEFDSAELLPRFDDKVPKQFEIVGEFVHDGPLRWFLVGARQMLKFLRRNGQIDVEQDFHLTFVLSEPQKVR